MLNIQKGLRFRHNHAYVSKKTVRLEVRHSGRKNFTCGYRIKFLANLAAVKDGLVGTTNEIRFEVL